MLCTLFGFRMGPVSWYSWRHCTSLHMLALLYLCVCINMTIVTYLQYKCTMASKSHFSMPLVILLKSSGNQSNTGSKEADEQCWTKHWVKNTSNHILSLAMSDYIFTTGTKSRDCNLYLQTILDMSLSLSHQANTWYSWNLASRIIDSKDHAKPWKKF